jgi:hypothetical protein
LFLFTVERDSNGKLVDLVDMTGYNFTTVSQINGTYTMWTMNTTLNNKANVTLLVSRKRRKKRSKRKERKARKEGRKKKERNVVQGYNFTTVAQINGTYYVDHEYYPK